MRLSVMSSCCVVLLLAAISSALPVAQPADAVQLLPAKETLHTLDLGEPKSDDSTRGKRTIGFLRETFPTLSEIVDRLLQTVTRFLFRVIGRLVLGGGGAGGTGADVTESRGGGASASSSSSGGNGRRISITLPTYAPSLDDDEDEEEEESDSSPAASSNDVLDAASDNAAVTVQAPQQNSEVKSRVARAVDQEAAATENEPSVDQDAAAAEENRDKRFLFGAGGGEGGSGSAGGSGNFLFDIIRRSMMGYRVERDVQGAADGTGRAAGSFYRLVAGTSEDTFPSLFYPVNASGQQPAKDTEGGSLVRVSRTNASITLTLHGGTETNAGAVKPTGTSLIAGSGTTEEAVDAEHGTSGAGAGAGIGYSAGAAAIETPELDGKPDDGYTSGIPGPITRLFVIANRGVSNLIQDLILRLAQTSERIVNFKARLITSII